MRRGIDEVWKMLQGLKLKYENDIVITEQINFQNYNITGTDGFFVLKEYVGMISDVTNVLNFHIKSQSIQLSEAKDV